MAGPQAIDNATVGRVLIDPAGGVVEADEAARGLLGLPRSASEAQVGARLGELGLFVGAPSDEMTADAQAAVDGGRSIQCVSCRALDGWTVALWEVEAGPKREAQPLWLQLAHELRTPLTALRGSLEQLEKRPGGERESELMAACRRNVERLVDLVANLVDTIAVMTGELRLHVADEEPVRLLADAVGTLDGRSADVQVEDAPADLPLVRADRPRVLRVLGELLDNALRHAGGTVEASISSGEGTVVFAVRDRGPGIPERLREDIFQPFQQADLSLTRAVGGLGLGLAVCKGIVERHGGRIDVAERDGGGSAFTVSLPAGSGDR